MNLKQIVPLIILVMIFSFICLPVIAAGTDQEEESGEFTHRVSAEGKSGITLWIINLYNDHRLIYACVTTLSMAVFGGLIALIVDFFLVRIGLTVTKMEHRE